MSLTLTNNANHTKGNHTAFLLDDLATTVFLKALSCLTN